MSQSRTSRLRAESGHTRAVADYLHEHGLTHLHVRQRAALITIESGPTGEQVPHARLRRIGANRWQLEMATHTARWQPTPIQASLEEVLTILVHDFGWTLQPIE